MYLRSIEIKGLRCFERLRLDFPERDGGHAGWHVLLGGNATGKTSLLQAMACALVGPFASQGLIKPQAWLREDHAVGEIRAELIVPGQTAYASEVALTGEEPGRAL